MPLALLFLEVGSDLRGLLGRQVDIAGGREAVEQGFVVGHGGG